MYKCDIRGDNMSMYPLILIADDDPVVHESLGLYLGSEGYEHQSAYDGQQALEMCESLHPDMKVAGKVIPCTPKEVEILHMLTSNVGQVFSREQILSRVWGYDYFGDTRTVDAHIKRIRQKLPQENVPWALKTVYGVGYRFEVNA